MADSPVTQQAMETYRNLMWEIRYRCEAIQGIVEGSVKPIRHRIAEEYCFLQLRMICEVIAIACLVIHGNLKPKATLLKSYKADWIMSELSKLHPRFYPKALTDSDRIKDGLPEFVEKTDGFLTKEELQVLWRQSGGVLHRGTVKSVLGKERPLQFEKVGAWLTKVFRLLERHTIETADENWLFYVVMSEVGTDIVVSELFERVPI